MLFVFEVLSKQQKTDGSRLLPDDQARHCAQTNKGIHSVLVEDLPYRRRDVDISILTQKYYDVTELDASGIHDYRLFTEESFKKANDLNHLEYLVDEFTHSLNLEYKLLEEQIDESIQKQGTFFNDYKNKLAAELKEKFENSWSGSEFSDFQKEIMKFNDNRNAARHSQNIITIKKQLLVLEHAAAACHIDKQVELGNIPSIKTVIQKMEENFPKFFSSLNTPGKIQSEIIDGTFNISCIYFDELVQLSKCTSSTELKERLTTLRAELWEKAKYNALRQNCSLSTMDQFFETAAYVFFNRR